ncbi:MAG: hypothetical protein OXQ29_18005 [Rhodospirillaceae bacterium]|nr:hypothetical protein [Rhodospirillaceae bacterium]
MATAIKRKRLHPFWFWVAGRKAHDNPRGDFIYDTRDLLERGIDPDTRIMSGCGEAKVQYERLKSQWERETGKSFYDWYKKEN